MKNKIPTRAQIINALNRDKTVFLACDFYEAGKQEYDDFGHGDLTEIDRVRVLYYENDRFHCDWVVGDFDDHGMAIVDVFTSSCFAERGFSCAENLVNAMFKYDTDDNDDCIHIAGWSVL